MRMAKDEPHQLFAGVTRRADDRDPGFCFHRAQCVFRPASIATKDCASQIAFPHRMAFG
jgi:hypothetical protein